MSIYKKYLGYRGEHLVGQFLKGYGHTILYHNITFPGGELDMVTLHEGELCFVEVKTRTNEAYGDPLESITQRKKENIFRSIGQFFTKYPSWSHVPYRVDVAIVRAHTSAPLISYYPYAITMDDVSAEY